ncbi:HipA domain-containing protein [Endozoicomonas sp. YOMI1]|uniref:HipA domain-containing protein n=1 Tax=Endozoicomonas sp. YOMI1 TaxID=2828739 RepID=UPI0021494B8E|nr:HipA domain-containing protein [Endozoicomonas sp. YOMI1]
MDFQLSPTDYIPRLSGSATLEQLLSLAARIEQGLPVPKELEQALHHGTSIGGARPKALIEDGDNKYIAKFSSSYDLYSMVKAEFIAMRLASLTGLNVADVSLAQTAGKDVLLIRRFDRELASKPNKGWCRKHMVSALPLHGLDEMMAPQAMLIKSNQRQSQLALLCLQAADIFLLTREQAKDIIEHQKATIEENWVDVCDEAELSEVDRTLFRFR